MVGCHVDMEHYRRCGCQLAVVDWPVRDVLVHFLVLACLDESFSAPLIQHSPENTEKFVFVTLAIAFLTYGRFVVLVINDITNYLGIACLTVRKKDAKGAWRDARPLSRSEKRV